jgi:hypothetical protein
VEKFGGTREATNDNMLDKQGYTNARTRARAAPTRTHINTEKYLILTAFAWQEWLRERASTLRYMYLACLISALTEPH